MIADLRTPAAIRLLQKQLRLLEMNERNLRGEIGSAPPTRCPEAAGNSAYRSEFTGTSATALIWSARYCARAPSAPRPRRPRPLETAPAWRRIACPGSGRLD